MARAVRPARPALPAAPGAPRPKGSSSLLTFASFGLVFLILFNPALRNALGEYAGFVLNPLIGFHGRYPVLTILISGSLLVVLSTILRHFTTDWIKAARTQAHMRHFQSEMNKARKENNTYKLKQLTEAQPKVMAGSQELQQKQMKTMPLSMIVAVPIYAWVTTFLLTLDYRWFSTPWNAKVDMFSNTGIIPKLGSLFPHWVLMYIALSIPLGSLVGKAMKYVAWKERWEKRHQGPT